MATVCSVAPQTHDGPPPRRGAVEVLPKSDGLNVLSLRALRALGDLELDALVLVQAAVALGLDRRVVHEDVGAAAVLSDEAEALLSVEPLHRTLCHAVVLQGTYCDRHCAGLMQDHASPRWSCGPS